MEREREKSCGRMTDGQSREWGWDGTREKKKAGAAGDRGDAPTKPCRAKAAGSAEPHRHPRDGRTSRGRRVPPEPLGGGCRRLPAERPPPPGTVPAALTFVGGAAGQRGAEAEQREEDGGAGPRVAHRGGGGSRQDPRPRSRGGGGGAQGRRHLRQPLRPRPGPPRTAA